MYQIPVKILKLHASQSSSYHNSKVCTSKVQKNLSKVNVYNTAIPFDFDFTVDTEDCYLKSYKVNHFEAQ